MSLPVTKEDQVPTTIEIQAWMEARAIAAKDKDYDFDENADWSFKEEGTVYDIDEEYTFVWSDLNGPWGAEDRGFEGGSILISGSADHNQVDKPIRCPADFFWRDFMAQFTCIYRPETQTFTNFQAKRKTLKGGMHTLESITVRMWQELWSMNKGEWIREEKEVKDDREHLFLFVHMEGGTSTGLSNTACVYGKKEVKVGGQDNIVLTEQDRRRKGEVGVTKNQVLVRMD